MKIESLKELQKVIKTCRALGVQSIKIDNVEFHLGDIPSPVIPKVFRSNETIPTITPGGITEDVKIITDELTPDQLLFYSAVGNTEYETQEPS